MFFLGFLGGGVESLIPRTTNQATTPHIFHGVQLQPAGGALCGQHGLGQLDAEHVTCALGESPLPYLSVELLQRVALPQGSPAAELELWRDASFAGEDESVYGGARNIVVPPPPTVGKTPVTLRPPLLI